MSGYIGLTPPADGTSAITASLATNGTLFTTETFGYNTISIQLSGDWQALCTFQVSNDNTYWANVQGYTFNNYMNSTNTAQDNGVYIFPVTGRYFRIVVSNYVSGTVATVSYLRQQSLAGIGETMLTQAMDSVNNTPMNVIFPGMTASVGQQSAATSIPVAMATEQIQDKFIIGKVFTNNVPVNTVLSGDASGSANLNGWIDCTQYRSAYISIYQSASATSGAAVIEVSNDGVNALQYPAAFFDTQGVAAGNTAVASTMSLGTATGATTLARVGSIGWRYLRLRVSTAFVLPTAGMTVQAFITLRQTTAPYVVVTQANMQVLANANFPVANNAAGAVSYSTSLMPIGGFDNSIVNPQIQGAPYPISTTNNGYLAGPYWRRNYVDFTGGVGAVGPDPRYAEDKTSPVNVRLERSTASQDSVQDLLQQMLVELKAHNYYLRELPQAIAAMNQLPNPQAASNPASMQDDSENFADDPTTYRYQKGH